MDTKIAILHGGPNDRMQIDVDRHLDYIHCAVNYPLMAHKVFQVPEHEVRVMKAVYYRVSRPVNPARDLNDYSLIWLDVPRHEVALYVFIGYKVEK